MPSIKVSEGKEPYYVTKNKSATPEKRTHSCKSENSSTINNDSVTNKNTPDRCKSKFTYQFVRSHPQKKYVSKIPNIIQTKLISKEAANDANVLSVKNNRNKESEIDVISTTKDILTFRSKDHKATSNKNTHSSIKSFSAHRNSSVIFEECVEEDSFDNSQKNNAHPISKHNQTQGSTIPQTSEYSFLRKSNSFLSNSLSKFCRNKQNDSDHNKSREEGCSNLKDFRERNRFTRDLSASQKSYTNNIIVLKNNESHFNSRISPISIKVDLVGKSWQSKCRNFNTFRTVGELNCLSSTANLPNAFHSLDEERHEISYAKDPIGVEIKLKIPTNEKQDYSNSKTTESSHYFADQDLLKENLSLKRKLELANVQIEKLKFELEKERNSKLLGICKICKEKGSQSSKFSNFDDYINKQISRIKKEYDDDLLFQKLELEAASETNKISHFDDPYFKPDPLSILKQEKANSNLSITCSSNNSSYKKEIYNHNSEVNKVDVAGMSQDTDLNSEYLSKDFPHIKLNKQNNPFYAKNLNNDVSLKDIIREKDMKIEKLISKLSWYKLKFKDLNVTSKTESKS